MTLKMYRKLSYTLGLSVTLVVGMINTIWPRLAHNQRADCSAAQPPIGLRDPIVKARKPEG